MNESYYKSIWVEAGGSVCHYKCESDKVHGVVNSRDLIGRTKPISARSRRIDVDVALEGGQTVMGGRHNIREQELFRMNSQVSGGVQIRLGELE